jgi:hypothetical protein
MISIDEDELKNKIRHEQECIESSRRYIVKLKAQLRKHQREGKDGE